MYTNFTWSLVVRRILQQIFYDNFWNTISFVLCYWSKIIQIRRKRNNKSTIKVFFENSLKKLCFQNNLLCASYEMIMSSITTTCRKITGPNNLDYKKGTMIQMIVLKKSLQVATISVSFCIVLTLLPSLFLYLITFLDQIAPHISCKLLNTVVVDNFLFSLSLSLSIVPIARRGGFF